MTDPLEQENKEAEIKVSRVTKKHVFKLPDGQEVPASEFKSISKFDRDVLVYCHGETKVTVPSIGKKKEKIQYATDYDTDQPLPANPIVAGISSPICKQCGLYEHGSKNPFISYAGSDTPLVTIIMDSVGRGEDVTGQLASEGSAAVIRRIIEESSEQTGVTLNDVRWVPTTRCANWEKKQVNFKPRGNWCRYHVVDDIMWHPPALIIPVGTTALGLLSHKSNAQEWGGRLLTYRGWPDDWLTNPKYALPRKIREDRPEMITGHPLFGAVPDWKIPMVPVQAPRLIFKEQNPVVRRRWEGQIVKALKMAKDGVKALSYIRDWYVFTQDVELVESTLKELLNHPKILLSYDTETTGLRPLAPDAAIVSMMFRWTDPGTGKPKSIGFPWDYGPTSEYPDYETSPMRPYIKRLKLLVWKVLTQSMLVGHNLTFDMLYTYGTFWRDKLSGWSDPAFNRRRDGWLCKLADACHYDTWHMAFAWQQKRGSLGLEAIAYDWVPELAGYEEDMTLMIDLNYDRMHPAAGKGGHYLNCPQDKWKSHVVPYVMGDVEVCYKAHGKIKSKLEKSTIYQFPLADPNRPGCFRYFAPPDRNWVYNSVISPASSVLMKLMARGLYIDAKALGEMEDKMPKEIMELRKEVETVDPRIEAWCLEKKAKDDEWELDLENKSQIKELLFERLSLPVMRFTKQGRKLLGDDVAKAVQSMSAIIASEKPELADDAEALAEAVQVQLRAVAAVDKFTLNKICVDFEKLRPLQKYKRAFKLYSTYVRPVRNLFTEKLDKKERKADPHLCFDQCIHASFLLTGTRSGRLSSRCLPLATPVATQNGIVLLSTVKPGDTIQSSTGPSLVTAFALTGMRETVVIETKSGRRLECSPDHLIFADGEWKPAGKISANDSLYICGIPAPDSPGEVGLTDVLIEDSVSKKSGIINQPEYLTSNLAFILGHYIAEGCIGFNKARKSTNKGKGGNQHGSHAQARVYLRQHEEAQKVPYRLIIAYGHDEKKLACRLEQLYFDVFGIKGKHSCTGITKSPVYVINSKTLAAWFMQHGCGGYSNEKRVPPAIMISPLPVVISFLRGLFEGDGSACSGKAILNTDSYGLANDVLLLLSRLGIHAGVNRGHRKEGNDRFYVRVYVESQGEAFKLFWSLRKRSELAKNSEKIAQKSIRILPGMQLPKGTLAAWRVNSGVTHYLSKSMLAEWDGLWLSEKANAFVSWVNAAKARTDEVVSVSYKAAQPMCDITVESGDFLVNGIRLHNSPNLQQLPREGLIKSMFASRFGERGCMYAADLSQIELRLMACACGDPKMVKAYFDGTDLHSLTASNIFSLPYANFSKGYMKDLQAKGKEKEAKELDEKRTISKTANFLTGYGGGAFGLQNVLAMRDINKKIEECQAIVEAFFDAYPALKKWIQKYKRFILNSGVAVSLFGRVRVFEEVKGDDEEAKAKAQRAGVNHAIQATASDMMLIALFTIEAMMRQENLESILVSTVHDSLLIDCVRDELPVIHGIAMEVLSNFPNVFKALFGDDYDTSWMITPFDGDADSGVNYNNTFKLSKSNVDWDEVYAKLKA